MSSKPKPAPFPSNFLQFALRERGFLFLLIAATTVAALTFQEPAIAMWVGFAFAGYSAVANDSIQTLGTFMASNRQTPWWILWLYIGGVFIFTILLGWFIYDGDVSWQRLSSSGFDIAPTQFSFLQIAAPLLLLVLTRMRMPVSTSILLLSCFATTSDGITDVILKSVGGYGVAFVIAFTVWGTLGRWMQNRFRGTAHPIWRVFQYCTTGMLWSVWLAQDAANVAVFLPRQLSAIQVTAFIAVIFVGLGVLFYRRGENIQQVVEEKAAVADVRPAATIDFIYGLILAYKMVSSTIPMSTTWVFVGLLGGRELALTWTGAIPGRNVRGAIAIMTRDLVYVTLGLLVSLALAFVVNGTVRHAWVPSLFTAEAGACVHIQSGAMSVLEATTREVDRIEETPLLIPHAATLVSRPNEDPNAEAWFTFASTGKTVQLLVAGQGEADFFDAHGNLLQASRELVVSTCIPESGFALHRLDAPEGLIRVRLAPGDKAQELVVLE